MRELLYIKLIISNIYLYILIHEFVIYIPIHIYLYILIHEFEI